MMEYDGVWCSPDILTKSSPVAGPTQLQKMEKAAKLWNLKLNTSSFVSLDMTAVKKAAQWKR